MPNNDTTIFKVRRKKGQYAALPNSLLRDTSLTFEARGLLAYLLSLPEDWEIRFGALIKQSPARRTALRRIIKECIAAGYMKRERVKAGGGRFQWVTEVYEEPNGAAVAAVSEDSPSAGFRPMEDLPAEDLSAETPSVERLSIKEIRRDESATDERPSETKTGTTGTTARAVKRPENPYPPDEQATPPPSPTDRILIPEPFPVDASMREWAGKECPLVNVEDATEKFVIEYSPQGKAGEDAPRFGMKLWLNKWRTWMRREQRFEQRDRTKDPALDGDRPQPYVGGAATVNFAQEQQAKGKYAFCPDCLGTGMRMEAGKGVTGKCKHERWVAPAAHEVGQGDAEGQRAGR